MLTAQDLQKRRDERIALANDTYEQEIQELWRQQRVKHDDRALLQERMNNDNVD